MLRGTTATAAELIAVCIFLARRYLEVTYLNILNTSNFSLNICGMFKGQIQSHMNTFYWHMNATHRVAHLLPRAILHLCANLHQGANCAYKRGFKTHNTQSVLLSPAWNDTNNNTTKPGPNTKPHTQWEQQQKRIIANHSHRPDGYIWATSWFPTIWHFDKCRCRRAFVASI